MSFSIKAEAIPKFRTLSRFTGTIENLQVNQFLKILLPQRLIEIHLRHTEKVRDETLYCIAIPAITVVAIRSFLNRKYRRILKIKIVKLGSFAYVN